MRKSVFTPEYAALRAELVKARAGAGLSQRELARRLEVPHSWIAKAESGERRVDLIEFLWFIRACDTDAMPPLLSLLKKVRPAVERRPRKGAR